MLGRRDWISLSILANGRDWRGIGIGWTECKLVLTYLTGRVIKVLESRSSGISCLELGIRSLWGVPAHPDRQWLSRPWWDSRRKKNQMSILIPQNRKFYLQVYKDVNLSGKYLCEINNLGWYGLARKWREQIFFLCIWNRISTFPRFQNLKNQMKFLRSTRILSYWLSKSKFTLAVGFREALGNADNYKDTLPNT